MQENICINTDAVPGFSQNCVANDIYTRHKVNRYRLVSSVTKLTDKMIIRYFGMNGGRYCKSKNSCPFLCCEYTMKIGQDFLDIPQLI